MLQREAGCFALARRATAVLFSLFSLAESMEVLCAEAAPPSPRQIYQRKKECTATGA